MARRTLCVALASASMTALALGCSGGTHPASHGNAGAGNVDAGGGAAGNAGASGMAGGSQGGASEAGDAAPGPAVCGNGALEAGEQCDDGNHDDGDGCSSTCTVESGWKCNAHSPSVCAKGVPYAPSEVITSLSWDYGSHVQLASGSDIWAATWGADGNVWAAWGDGGGFGGSNTDHRVSIGFAKISGTPPNVTGTNVWGNSDAPQSGGWAQNQATFCGKSGAMVSVGGTLYAWIAEYNNPASGEDPSCAANPSPMQDRLAWSSDTSQTWNESSSVFTESSGTLIPDAFVQFGEDGAGEPALLGGYVYMYAFEAGDSSDVFLVRVLTANLKDQSQYRVFTGLHSGAPTWSTSWDPSSAVAVFIDPNGASSFSATYHSVSGRILAAAYHGIDVNGDVGAQQDLGLFAAPAPWGPWSTVYYTNSWGPSGAPFGTQEAEAMSIPPKWISADGTQLWVVFSAGSGPPANNPGDALNLMQATLTLDLGGP
jgi:cysteine-rich repeat protein